MKIGVFDSGVGGLTVLRALMDRIPEVDYLYLGDTARLPYGAKSRTTVARYAASSARFLVGEGAEFLVIACNTASALALDAIRDAASVPVLGVVETGANAAQVSSDTRDVMVMATAATVESHAYAAACAVRGLRTIEKACPLLVPLVEEGWIEHPVTSEVLRIYLAELMEQARAAELHPDTLVLGCTHYPLLRTQIERAVPETLQVIDSAAVTAAQVERRLGILRGAVNGARPARFFATDSVVKFRTLGSRFLGRAIDDVELVDLGN
ncbi:MAG TPA: glutamate racemase [Acidobacteriaceae bacterium]|nr:glutamate racemase [Acidobacteriaceae bacterium]